MTQIIQKYNFSSEEHITLVAHMPLFINNYFLVISTVYDHHVQTQDQ